MMSFLACSFSRTKARLEFWPTASILDVFFQEISFLPYAILPPRLELRDCQSPIIAHLCTCAVPQALTLPPRPIVTTGTHTGNCRRPRSRREREAARLWEMWFGNVSVTNGDTTTLAEKLRTKAGGTSDVKGEDNWHGQDMRAHTGSDPGALADS